MILQYVTLVKFVYRQPFTKVKLMTGFSIPTLVTLTCPGPLRRGLSYLPGIRGLWRARQSHPRGPGPGVRYPWVLSPVNHVLRYKFFSMEYTSIPAKKKWHIDLPRIWVFINLKCHILIE